MGTGRLIVIETPPLRRLIKYSRPYLGRLVWALVAMVFYAVGSAGVAALIRTTIDDVLPPGTNLGLVAWAVIGLTLLQGGGSSGSSHLMARVGQAGRLD